MYFLQSSSMNKTIQISGKIAEEVSRFKYLGNYNGQKLRYKYQVG